MKRGRPVKAIYQREGLLKTLMDEYDVALLPDKDSRVNVFHKGFNYITSFDLVKAGAKWMAEQGLKARKED